MKKICFTFLFFSSQLLFAQRTNPESQSGVYLSWQDFKSGKLSYILNCDSNSEKIKLNHFLSKNYIDVIQGENKIRLCKDSIYGYRDCKLNDYRFFKNKEEEFLIVENKGIIIYSSNVAEIVGNGKRIEMKKAYFFSTSINTEIVPLTLINLKRAFSNNLKFHDILDLEFFGQKDILTYDSIHNMYKVNSLLSQSINQ